MGEQIKSKEYQILETYLEQSVRNNAPVIYKNIREAKEQNLMLVIESSDLKINIPESETIDTKAFNLIGMIIKYASMQGVEVRIAPDGSLEPEEK